METFWIYVILQADTVRIVVRMVFFLSLIGTAILTIVIGILSTSPLGEEEEATLARIKRLWKKFGVTLIIALCIFLVIPSTRTLILAYGGSEIFQLEELNKLPQKSIDGLNKLLDGYLEK